MGAGQSAILHEMEANSNCRCTVYGHSQLCTDSVAPHLDLVGLPSLVYDLFFHRTSVPVRPVVLTSSSLGTRDSTAEETIHEDGQGRVGLD